MRNISLLLLFIVAMASRSVANTPSVLLDSIRESDPAYQVRERGLDFAVFEKVTGVTNDSGATSFTTNQFTLLENGLHYLEAGEWKTSEDLIEPFPDGAVARRGPNKTIFSPELRTESVFDILTAEGDRIRGGVRSIQLTDFKTGAVLFWPW